MIKFKYPDMICQQQIQSSEGIVVRCIHGYNIKGAIETHDEFHSRLAANGMITGKTLIKKEEMTEEELLRHLRNGLYDQSTFPNFGSILIVPDNIFRIFLTETQEQFTITCVKEQENMYQELTGNDIPTHLRSNALTAICNRCGRESVAEEDFGQEDRMTQPDSNPCGGKFSDPRDAGIK